jgi:hypothetical protein
MQQTGNIQLRQARDFGQIITTTFTFLRQEWKPLARAILAIGLPTSVAGGFLAGGTVAKFQGFQMAPSDDPSEILGALASSLPLLLLGFLLLIVAWLLVVSMVHEYIRAYHLGEHHGITTPDLLKRGVSQVGPYLGASLLTGLLCFLGMILCVLPFFYAWAVLALVLPAHAIERTGGAGALGRSNQLVSGDFWPTLGLLFVIAIINGFINGIIQLPFTIVGIVVGINTGMEGLNSGSAELPAWWELFNSIGSAVQWCVQMLTYPIIAVCMALKYFSRVEETEGLGLKEKLAGFDQA